MNKTLGLAVITNRPEQAAKLVADYGQYFDKIYLTVAHSDKMPFYELRKRFKDDPKVELSYFKWVKSFGKARRFNETQIKTDYYFWMDDDDSVDRPDLLRSLMVSADQKQLDCVFLNYNYYQNAQGEAQADHWRERLIRTRSAEWFDEVCHETYNAANLRCERNKDISVIHHKTYAEMNDTVDRNFELLLNDWQTKKDPRTAFYLGMTYMTKQDFDQAIEMFMFLIEHGGWDEQKIVAWNRVADCYYMTNQFDKALVATNMAMHMDPSHPDSYYQKVIIYSMSQQYDKAVEWASVAMTKQPKESTMQLIDPTNYTYKGLFLAAQAYLFSGRVKEGFQLFQRVKQQAPHYIEEVTQETKQDWSKIFEEAFYDEKAIDYTRYLTHYTKDFGGDPKKLFESLPRKVFSDVRLNAERVMVYPPKKWPTKTIAYYCGPGVEAWGPDMMATGLGGSEEAVIYLSRELAKLGWAVTVFGDREEPYFDEVGKTGVWYRPWTELNPWDEFDVFVASRQPANLKGVKARIKILDLHDVNQPESVYAAAEEVDKIFVKTKWHRQCFPKIPDDKFVIVGNGLYMKNGEFYDGL